MAWAQAGRLFELHIYSQGGHGFGMSRQDTTSDLWIDQFHAWMRAGGFLVPMTGKSGEVSAYSVEKTKIGTLLDDPEAKAALQAIVPDLFQVGPGTGGMRGLTFADLRKFVPDYLTDEKMAQIRKAIASLGSPTQWRRP